MHLSFGEKAAFFHDVYVAARAQGFTGEEARALATEELRDLMFEEGDVDGALALLDELEEAAEDGTQEQKHDEEGKENEGERPSVPPEVDLRVLDFAAARLRSAVMEAAQESVDEVLSEEEENSLFWRRLAGWDIAV